MQKIFIARLTSGMKDIKQEDTLIGTLNTLNFNMLSKLNME